MNILAVALPRLDKLHENITEESKLREEFTSQLNIQVEKEQATLSQNLNQTIQERDQIEKEYYLIKNVVETTCKGILNMEVREEEPEEGKVTKIVLAIKEQKDKVAMINLNMKSKLVSCN